MSTKDEDFDPLVTLTPRIFISRVDTYFGQILAQHLGRSIPGETGPDGQDLHKENLSDLTFLNKKHRHGAFRISASWKPDRTKAAGERAVEALIVPVLENLILADNRIEMIKIIKETDICIVHIIDEDGQNDLLGDAINVMDIAQQAVKEFNRPKTIILLSTTMTWAKTKAPGQGNALDGHEPSPPDEEEEVHSFNEEDYKKRRPHPSYQKHLEIEKDFLKLGRDSKGLLASTVVVAGLIYGYGENILSCIFKDAWQGQQIPLIVPGDGKNHVPMIHARDLCQVVQNICDSKPISRYIIAVDQGNESLSKVCQAVSKVLSMGQTVAVPAAELLKSGKIKQYQCDLLTCNLRMTPSIIKEQMKIRWLAEKGLAECAAEIIEEFRLLRHLKPIKLAVLGPPFSGKTSMAKRLSQFYAINYLNVKDVVEEALEALHATVQAAKVQALKHVSLAEQETEEEEKEGLSEGEVAQELLSKIEEGMARGQAQVEEMYVIQFLREKLLSSVCQNQGFVLDNFPDTYARARDLFINTTDSREGHNGNAVRQEEGDEELAAKGDFSSKTIPDFVLLLEADEDFLRQRMMLQAEPSPSLAANGAATSTTTIDQQFKQRMAEYKLLQENEASTAINYFHQIEIPSITLAISKDIGKTTEISLNTAISIIGPPHNYGMAVDQRRDLLEKNEKRRKAEKKEREEMKNAKKEKIWADKQRHCTQWLAEMDHINRERYQQVVRGTMPIEDYLAKNVLPAVQRGLLAMLKCRPKNPIDFLGHFLIDLTNPLTHASQLDVHGQSLKVARR